MYRIAIALDPQEEDIRFIKQRGDYLEFVCEECASLFPLESALDIVRCLNDISTHSTSECLVYTFFLIRILED